MNTEVRIQQLAYFQAIKHKTMEEVVKVSEGICYVMPDSDEEYIIAVEPFQAVATNTYFYEADDFYYHSDYNYIYRDGIIQPKGL